MPTSAQITAKVMSSSNPRAAMAKLWERTRYLVAQVPASENDNTTKEGYYNGRTVVPGPKANGKLTAKLTVHDLNYVTDELYIRFIDSNTTSGAPANVSQALYTVMSDAEADDYEKHLRAQRGGAIKQKEVA